MKVINLINKLAKGETMPHKIEIYFAEEDFKQTFEYDEEYKDYFDDTGDRLFEDYDWVSSLNDEITHEEYVINISNMNISCPMEDSKKEMEDKLLQIIEHYGEMKQLKYFQTEVFELTEAIIKAYYDEFIYFPDVEEKHKKDIAEEIADIQVMLYQFQLLYKLDNKEIIETMKYKINRQIERIEGEKNGNI